MQTLSQEPLLTIDLTPRPGLALDILKAYRENCNCRWVGGTAGMDDDPTSPIIKQMNEDQKARAKILDSAILLLKAASGVDWPGPGMETGLLDHQEIPTKSLTERT